jgi:hypothetical protein
MSQAVRIMTELNRNALHGRENGYEVFIEDVQDPDGRWFRLEYRTREDGTDAHAFCRYHPWGVNRFGYHQSHLREDGFICVGSHLSDEYSPYDLEFAVKRARFWAGGFSTLNERGFAETCRLIPEWNPEG